MSIFNENENQLFRSFLKFCVCFFRSNLKREREMSVWFIRLHFINNGIFHRKISPKCAPREFRTHTNTPNRIQMKERNETKQKKGHIETNHQTMWTWTVLTVLSCILDTDSERKSEWTKKHQRKMKRKTTNFIIISSNTVW